MTDVLYVKNGAGIYEPIDMDGGTKITLNYKSNLMGDVSKLSTSSTLSIKVPKTTHNRRLFDNASSISYASSFPRRGHDCYIERNGIRLVEGYCVLIGSGEEYSLTVFWGLRNSVDKWIDTGVSINDLEDNLAISWMGAVIDTMVNEPITDAGYRRYAFANEYKAEIDRAKEYNVLPVVSARYILQRIAEANGLTFDFQTNAEVTAALDALLIPCVTANGSPLTWEEYQVSGSGYLRYNSPYKYLQFTSVKDPKGRIVTRSIGGGYSQTYFNVEDVTEVYVWLSLSYSNYRIYLYDEDFNQIALPIEGVNGTIINVEDCAYIAMTQNVANDVAVDVIVRPLFDELDYPSIFGVIANLPDIKQIDFIKAVCALFHLQVLPSITDAATIVFMPLSDIVANTNYYDWSNNLIAGSDEDPEEIAYSDDDFAQSNIFKYKGDSTLGQGVLDINDATLELSKDFYTLPFEASETSKSGSAIMRIVEKEGDDLTRIDLGPRIVFGDGTKAVFTGLAWPDLLDKYYGTMHKIMNNYIAIKAKFRLMEVELQGLDYRKPIYLEQYGRYFLIKTLQVQTDICTAELIQLPIN